MNTVSNQPRKLGILPCLVLLGRVQLRRLDGRSRKDLVGGIRFQSIPPPVSQSDDARQAVRQTYESSYSHGSMVRLRPIPVQYALYL